MFYIPFSIMIMGMGFFLYFLVYNIPLLRIVYFDWIALIIICIPTIILIYGIVSKKVLYFIEKVPKGKALIFFLRRDGEVVPVLGSRAYPGESFLDIPRLGIVHDLGKGSVYNLGMNKVRFVLENVNHTPQPRYANFTDWLYKIGFNNIQELQATLNGSFPEKEEEVIEKIPRWKAEPIDILEKELKETVKPFPKKADGDDHTVAASFIDRMRKDL